jgi:Uma2 family endonuclease
MPTIPAPTGDPPALGPAPVYSEYVLRKAKETGLDPAVIPDITQLVTEDDTPVDIFTRAQQGLLTEALYSSWARRAEGGPFLTTANVGYFYRLDAVPVVPDFLLSLDVSLPDLHSEDGQSYFQWVIGKPPDVVIEIVSDRRGGEESHKQRLYLRQNVRVYVIFDPCGWLEGGVLRVFVLERGRYVPHSPGWLPEIGLGLTLWEGVFEGLEQTWLRWCDQNGQVIPTAEESRNAERQRAENAAAAAERLRAQLRALGIEPEV